MFWRVWSAFWRELNTPDAFTNQPYLGFINQVGHLALANNLAKAFTALWYDINGTLPDLWAVAVLVTLLYSGGIELFRQKWRGADTVLDSTFVALGASLVPVSMIPTPSGRWFRTEDWSSGFLFWLACAVLALALYVYPRAKRAYGGTNDPAE